MNSLKKISVFLLCIVLFSCSSEEENLSEMDPTTEDNGSNEMGNNGDGSEGNSTDPDPDPDGVDPNEESQPNETPLAFDLISEDNGAVNVNATPTLNWQASRDPDGDTVTYDIYLDKEMNPVTLLAENITTTSFELSTRLNHKETFYWKVIAKDGKGGEVASQSTFSFTTRKMESSSFRGNFGRRQKHSTLVFDGKIWVMAGSGSGLRNDVWSSTDGMSWTQVLARGSSTSFSVRDNQGAAVFNNKMWIIGGRDGGALTGGERKNDVWSSVDGKQWVQETAAAAFTGRNFPSVVAFNNKIWVMGGADKGSGRRNDFWSSSDGVNWTEVIPSGARPEDIASAFVFKNKLHVVDSLNNLLWISSDGVQWNQQTINTPSPRFISKVMILDNKLWTFRGEASSGTSLWSSPDGINWTNETIPTPISNRNSFTTAVFNNKLWLLAGFISGDTTFTDEVWALE